MQAPTIDQSGQGPYPAVLRYLVTLFGCIAMYMFSLYKGFSGTTPRLRILMPGKPDVFYDRLDFLIVAVSGSIIGTIFFKPHDNLQALAAGFGWVGALSVLTNQKTGGDQKLENRTHKKLGEK